MVDLLLLAVLQVRMRQDVVGGESTQQLLGAAAVQGVLTAVRGSDSFGGAPQTPTLPTERTPGGAGSLTDGAARDHRVVLTKTERENYSSSNDLHLILLCIQVCCTKLPLLTLYRYFCFTSARLYCLSSCFFFLPFPFPFKST